VVNLSDAPAYARVHLPWDDIGGTTWELRDRLDGRAFERDGDDMAADGLFVELDPWRFHFLAFRSAPQGTADRHGDPPRSTIMQTRPPR
jgi:hypothetical protein